MMWRWETASSFENLSDLEEDAGKLSYTEAQQRYVDIGQKFYEHLRAWLQKFNRILTYSSDCCMDA